MKKPPPPAIPQSSAYSHPVPPPEEENQTEDADGGPQIGPWVTVEKPKPRATPKTKETSDVPYVEDDEEEEDDLKNFKITEKSYPLESDYNINSEDTTSNDAPETSSLFKKRKSDSAGKKRNIRKKT
ncbi:hypothetical protein K7432_012102 [Basidiobolus ranarum]